MESKIGEFKVIEKLDAVGSASVEVVQAPDNRTLVLKKLAVTKSDFNQEIQKELEITKTFDHPNILPTNEFIFDPKEQTLITLINYCKDGNLTQLISKGDIKDVSSLIRGIAKGVQYLHQQIKIPHKNLKSTNILLDDQTPKIADLGLTTLIKEPKKQNLFYQPREVIETQAYTFQSDIYSLGIIFLQLMLQKSVNNFIPDNTPPYLIQNFPSQDLLLQVQNQRMQMLISLMLQANPQKRIKIEQIINILQFKNPIIVPWYHFAAQAIKQINIPINLLQVHIKVLILI